MNLTIWKIRGGNLGFFDPIIFFMNVLLRNEHKKW